MLAFRRFEQVVLSCSFLAHGSVAVDVGRCPGCPCSVDSLPELHLPFLFFSCHYHFYRFWKECLSERAQSCPRDLYEFCFCEISPFGLLPPWTCHMLVFQATPFLWIWSVALFSLSLSWWQWRLQVVVAAAAAVVAVVGLVGLVGVVGVVGVAVAVVVVAVVVAIVVTVVVAVAVVLVVLVVAVADATWVDVAVAVAVCVLRVLIPLLPLLFLLFLSLCDINFVTILHVLLMFHRSFQMPPLIRHRRGLVLAKTLQRPACRERRKNTSQAGAGR